MGIALNSIQKMARFHCRNCNYEFDLRTERVPKACPYCGKLGVISREKGAEELLNEVDKLLKE